MSENAIHRTVPHLGFAANGGEGELFACLARAIRNGVRDIDDGLRQQAVLLPASAFVSLFADVNLQEIRKVAYADNERMNLHIISRLCQGFCEIPVAHLKLESIQVICSELETGGPTNGGSVYNQRSVRAYVGSMNRLLQFMGSPPLRLIQPDKLFPMLAETEPGTKNRAVGRVKRLLETSSRRAVTWSEVQMQLRRESEWRGVSQEAIERMLEHLRMFLEGNSQAFGGTVSPEFAQAASQALSSRNADACDVKIPAGLLQNEVFVVDIMAALRTTEALAESNFTATLFRFLPRLSGMTYGEFGNRFGLAKHQLKVWVADRHAFTTNITPKQALEMDEFFAADGVLFASYAATTQHTVNEPIRTVIDDLLERTAFAEVVRKMMGAVNASAKELADAFREETGLKLDAGLLMSWAQGGIQPTQEHRDIIEALDKFAMLDGTLTAAWRAAKPRGIYSCYGLPWSKWHDDLQRRHHHIVISKMENPQALPDNGVGWREDSNEVNLLLLAQSFFGYLVDEATFKGPSTFSKDDFRDLPGFVTILVNPSRPIDHWLTSRLSAQTHSVLADYRNDASKDLSARQVLSRDLNNLIEGSSIFEKSRFEGVQLRKQSISLLVKDLNGDDVQRLGRLLLEDAYPLELLSNQFIPEDLSHSLFCDRDLVEGWYGFLQARAGRKTFTQFAVVSSRVLVNLYEVYMSVLWPTATQEKHWHARLQSLAITPSQCPEGEDLTLDLTTPEISWRLQLQRAINSTHEFLRCNEFQSERTSTRAWPLIEAGWGVGDVLKSLQRFSKRQPTAILSMAAATDSRRLVECLLVVLLNLDTSELRRLVDKVHIRLTSLGSTVLDIPAAVLSSRMKGTPDELRCELKAPEWVHSEIRRYVEQSRPILVGAGDDAGFFFTASRGQKLVAGTIQKDMRIVLGYTAFGERDLFLASALAHGTSAEDVALVLRTTIHTVNSRHASLPPVKGQNATRAHDFVLNRTRKTKG